MTQAMSFEPIATSTHDMEEVTQEVQCSPFVLDNPFFLLLAPSCPMQYRAKLLFSLL